MKQQTFWQYAKSSSQRYYYSLFMATAFIALAYLINLNVFDNRIPSWLIIPAAPVLAGIIHYTWSWKVFRKIQKNN